MLARVIKEQQILNLAIVPALKSWLEKERHQIHNLMPRNMPYLDII